MGFLKSLGSAVSDNLKEKHEKYQQYRDYASRLSDERLLKEFKSTTMQIKKAAFFDEAKERGLVRSK